MEDTLSVPRQTAPSGNAPLPPQPNSTSYPTGNRKFPPLGYQEQPRILDRRICCLMEVITATALSASHKEKQSKFIKGRISGLAALDKKLSSWLKLVMPHVLLV
ncbi:hypothetical protein M405DRAFT_857033 [Rhizopogon salebrosus TDB-379]|nr:hypothetical protein M405DRAFT_857033 [Rhizopogon salebrosus TDB-379]